MGRVDTATTNFAQAIASYRAKRARIPAGVIAYRESGRGRALVLLHGIGSGSASWIRQLETLAGRFRVLAWDAPGYGESTPVRGDAPAAPAYAAALAQWLDALRVDECVLVGHSLGAIMAAAFASDHSQRIAHLVLLSPARGYGGASAEERERRLSERLATLDALGPDGIAAQRSHAMVAQGAAPEVVGWVAWNARRLVPSGYRQAARMLACEDITRYASHYLRPVLVASGAEDAVTPPESCRAVARAFPQGRYEGIPRAGHAVYLEAPEAVDRLLAQFGVPAALVPNATGIA